MENRRNWKFLLMILLTCFLMFGCGADGNETTESAGQSTGIAYTLPVEIQDAIKNGAVITDCNLVAPYGDHDVLQIRDQQVQIGNRVTGELSWVNLSEVQDYFEHSECLSSLYGWDGQVIAGSTVTDSTPPQQPRPNGDSIVQETPIIEVRPDGDLVVQEVPTVEAQPTQSDSNSPPPAQNHATFNQTINNPTDLPDCEGTLLGWHIFYDPVRPDAQPVVSSIVENLNVFVYQFAIHTDATGKVTYMAYIHWLHEGNSYAGWTESNGNIQYNDTSCVTQLNSNPAVVNFNIQRNYVPDPNNQYMSQLNFSNPFLINGQIVPTLVVYLD